MIRLLTATVLVASFSVVADTKVPNTFTDGTPAKASEVNENFDALEAAIDAIPEGPAGPAGAKGDTGEKGDKGDTGDQGIQGIQGERGFGGDPGPEAERGEKGDTGDQGPAGADGVVNGVTCTSDQVIVYRGDAWVCSSPDFVAAQFFSADPFGAAQGTVSCPSGKKVTGGGCNFRGVDGCGGLTSYPDFDLTGWVCEVTRNSQYDYNCYASSGYAICQ